MPKFKLVPDSTFKATAHIPVPGSKAEPIEFTFRHRSRDEYRELLESLQGKTDVELVMALAIAWNLADPFDATTIGQLVNNYHGAGAAIFTAYNAELTGAREKN